MPFEVKSKLTGHVAVFQNRPTESDMEEFESTIQKLTPQLKTGELTQPTFTQRAGSIIQPKSLKTLIPKKEDIPELLGSMAGTFAKRTLPGMALSGVFAGAGEASKQLAQRARIFAGQPPETASEAATKIGGAALTGAGGEILGRGVSKLFAPFAKSFTPAIQEGLSLAEREGITPPLKSITESKILQTTERIAESSINLYTRKVNEIAMNAVRQFGEFAERTVNMVGVKRPPEVQGNFIKETVKGFFENFIETKNKLYNSVFPKVKDLAVTSQNTISTLQEIIERESVPELGRADFFQSILDILQPSAIETRLAGGAVVGRKAVPAKPISGGATDVVMTAQEKAITLIKELRGALSPSGGLKVVTGIPSLLTEPSKAAVNTFGKLKKLQEIINKRIKFDDPSIRGLNAELQNVSLAISKDLDEVVTKFSPDLSINLQKANEYFGNGIELLKTKVFKGLKATSPGNEYKVVITPNAPGNVRIGREILGDNFKEVARQWLDDILEKSVVTSEGERFISPKKFSQNLDKYGSTVDEVFADSPQILQLVKEVQKVGLLLTRGEKITQGSQTAFVQSLLVPLFTGLIDPMLAAKQIAALSGVGLLITSKAGRKYLTSGFPKVGGIVGRTAQVVGQRVGQEMR